MARLKIYLFLFASLTTAYNANTQVSWIGGTGNWDVPGNWSSGLVPDISTDVLIGITDNVTIPANVTAMTKSLEIENSGTLTIASTGILNVDGSSENAITISGAGVQEIINSGTINIGSAIPITGIGVVLLNSSSYLRNEPSGIIKLNNIGSAAFFMNLSAKVINKGNILIGNVAQVQAGGFVMDNETLIDNYPMGNIEINNCPNGDGIYMQNSNVTNQGAIHIGNTSNVQYRGITMALGSLYTNYPGGTTTISRLISTLTGEGQGLVVTSSSDFVNSGTLRIGNNGAIINNGLSVSFEGSLTNSSTGVIDINNITNFDAISIVDDFSLITNSGTINIGNTAAIKRIGIFINNLGLFSNGSSGIINIDNINGTGTNYGYGMFVANGAGGGFTNNGHINIGTNMAVVRYGINVSSAGDFLNQSQGVIQVNNVSSFDGIEVTGANSIFTNSGTMHVGNLLGVRRTGVSLANGGNFTNSFASTLTINNIFGSLAGEGYGVYIANSSLTNNGSINLGNTSTIFNVGIAMSVGTLTNQSSGTIQINNIVTLDGISENGAGTLITNSGTIKIGNVTSVKRIGISMFSASEFQNTAGTLEINGITSTAAGTGYGIYIASNSTFTNNALIKIGNLSNISQTGVLIAGPASLTNQSSGSINIGNIALLDGILIQNANAILTNSGQIKIGEYGPIVRIGLFAASGAQVNNAAGSLMSINNITTLDGMEATGAGTTITNNGTLNIGNAASVYRLGLFMSTSTTFTNGATGTVTINNVISTTANEGIALRLSGSTFTNNNIIQIGNTTAISRFGVVMTLSSTLTNQAGSFEVNRITGFSAISLQTSAKIFNSGAIHIGNEAAINQSGIIMSGASEYYNQSGSTLSINRTTTLDAIDVLGAGTKFVNSAAINIGNLGSIGEDGIFVNGGGLFENNLTTGVINMENVTANSINLMDANTIFNNRGIINL